MLAVEVLSVTTAPDDWFAKVLPAVLAKFHAVPGWVWPVGAVIGVIVLCVPIRVDGADLVHIRRHYGDWILLWTIACCVFSLVKPAEWVQAWIRHGWQRRSAQRTVKKCKAEKLEELYEKHILMKQYCRGERTFRRPGGLADEALDRLVEKRLVDFSFMNSLYTIPLVIWNELQAIFATEAP